MNIGIDMMGGDFAPLEAVKGLKLFIEGQGTRDEGNKLVRDVSIINNKTKVKLYHEKFFP